MKSTYLKKIKKTLLTRSNLSFNQAKSVADLITTNKISDIQKATLLSLLSAKGETSEELAGFASLLRKKMTTIKTYRQAIDVCGTGGDSKSTFNISTTTAFVVAASGIPVAKHGNRSITSKCGSADVFEALGVNINLAPFQAEKILSQLGLTFLFAPKYHQAMRHVAKVRKELGFPTIFNYLGPLVNPAQVKIQLIGTYKEEIAKKIILTVKKLKVVRAAVVSSLDGMDEVSLIAPTIVYKLEKDKIERLQIHPNEFGFSLTSLNNLRGGKAKKNAEIIKGVLNNKDQGPKRDIVLLNSALAISLAKGINMRKALAIAKNAINSGKAISLLNRFVAMAQQ